MKAEAMLHRELMIYLGMDAKIRKSNESHTKKKARSQRYGYRETNRPRAQIEARWKKQEGTAIKTNRCFDTPGNGFKKQNGYCTLFRCETHAKSQKEWL